MEETLPSLKMKDIDLLNNLEISSLIPNRVIKVQGCILKETHKEYLEIIIFKGFSSSNTHQIEIDLKKVIAFRYMLTNLKLFKAPLKENKDYFIEESGNSDFFLDQKNWI